MRKGTKANWPTAGRPGLLPLAFALYDGDIAINREIRESFRLAARQRPLDFQPIDFFAVAQAENDTRIVRREIAPTANLHTPAFQIPGLIGDTRTSRVGIRLSADEAHT